MNIALLVGINAYPDNPLRGCLNDTEAVRSLLVGLGWSPMHIRVIQDHSATKDSILTSLSQMIERAQQGDHLVFHYSGHGSQVPCREGDETDGMDEVLCPYDFNWTDGYISDDMLRDTIRPLHRKSTLDVILDACHSGTGLREVGDPIAKFIPYPYSTVSTRGLWSYNKILEDLDQPNVALWAGCESNQTSADAYIDGKYRGAMTWAFCKTIANWNKDRHHVWLGIKQYLEYAGYDQEPQLECSDEMRQREIFT